LDDELPSFAQEELQVSRSNFWKLNDQLLGHSFFILEDGFTDAHREGIAKIGSARNDLNVTRDLVLLGG
jgi:hypothetical protein